MICLLYRYSINILLSLKSVQGKPCGLPCCGFMEKFFGDAACPRTVYGCVPDNLPSFHMLARAL